MEGNATLRNVSAEIAKITSKKGLKRLPKLSAFLKVLIKATKVGVKAQELLHLKIKDEVPRKRKCNV